MLIEAASEIPPSLPRRVTEDTKEELLKLGLQIRTGEPARDHF
jgi:hypothetical protein